MNTFVIDDFNVEDSNTCNFYTVRFDDTDTSETDKFYDKYFIDKGEYLFDMEVIHELISQIGFHGMNIIKYARQESKACALPPKAVVNDCTIDIFGNRLRLYYVQLTHNIVILFNGGIAHDDNYGRTPIELQEAQLFVKKIIDAIGTAFEIKSKRLIPLNEEIIIH